MDLVQQVVPSSTQRRVVLAAFEHDVEVWELGAFKQASAFATAFDFGGSRLALSDELDVLFVGAYHRHGLSAHDAETGEVRWTRKDLTKIQHLSLSKDGLQVFCGREGAPCEVVSGTDGSTVGRVRGARAVWDSRWEPLVFIDARVPELRDLAGRRQWRLPGDRSLLDVAFGREHVVSTEVAGSVTCRSIAGGAEMWRYDPGEHAHVVSLCYQTDDDCIVGLERPLRSGGDWRTIVWGVADGAVRSRQAFGGELLLALAGEGKFVIRSDRSVYSSQDGILQCTLRNELAT